MGGGGRSLSSGGLSGLTWDVPADAVGGRFTQQPLEVFRLRGSWAVAHGGSHRQEQTFKATRRQEHQQAGGGRLEPKGMRQAAGQEYKVTLGGRMRVLADAELQLTVQHIKGFIFMGVCVPGWFETRLHHFFNQGEGAACLLAAGQQRLRLTEETVRAGIRCSADQWLGAVERHSSSPASSKLKDVRRGVPPDLPRGAVHRKID